MMNPAYISGTPDLKEIKIVVELKDGRKKVVTYDGASGPAQLYAIRLMIDNIVSKTKWLY